MVRIGFSRARATISAPSFSSPSSLLGRLLDRRDAAQQGDAAAGHDALGHGRPGGVQGVLDAALGLLHLGLGGAADADDGHAAGQLGQPLAELLLVVLALGLLDLGAGSARCASGCRPSCRPRWMIVVLSFSTLTSWPGRAAPASTFSSFRPRSSLMNWPPVRTAMSPQHGLAAIAEARRLDRADVQHAAQLVDDQGRQRLALDVLGDDQQRLGRLGDLLQQRQHVADVGDLLLVDQDAARPPARTSCPAGW